MTNNRIATDAPRFLFDSDDNNRVVGIKQPNGTEEFFETSQQQPPATQAAMQSYVSSSAVAVSITNTLVETTLATITIPGNAMGPNGWFELEASFSFTNSANSKTFRFRYGGTTICSAAATTTTAFGGVARVQNRGATNSQVAGPANMAFGSATSAANVTTSQDTTAATTVLIQGTMAALAETITLERFALRVFKQG